MRVAISAAAGACLVLAACSQTPKEYDYPAWGFAASFPGPPKETDVPTTLPDGTTSASIQLDYATHTRELVAQAGDISHLGQIAEQAMTAGLNTAAAKYGGTVSAQTDITLDGFSGVEGTINSPGKPAMLIHEYVIGTRLYMVGAMSTQGLDDPVVKAFMASFKPIASPQPSS